MAESRETILSIIQSIHDATQPGSVTNKMVARVLTYLEGALPAEGTLVEKTALTEALEETILRLQGRSGNYNHSADPVKFREFTGTDATAQVNAWMDTLHGDAPESNANKVPHGLVHISVEGARLWLFNTPLSYAEDIWAQTVVNAEYGDGKIRPGNSIYRRLHNNQGVWEEWQVIGGYQIPAGGIPAHDLASAVQQLLNKIEPQGKSIEDIGKMYDTLAGSKADKVDIAGYMTTGSVLPHSAYYICSGNPIHWRMITGISCASIGIESYLGSRTILYGLVFCYATHQPTYGQGVYYAIYARPLSGRMTWDFIKTISYADAPDNIRLAFDDFNKDEVAAIQSGITKTHVVKISDIEKIVDGIVGGSTTTHNLGEFDLMSGDDPFGVSLPLGLNTVIKVHYTEVSVNQGQDVTYPDGEWDHYVELDAGNNLTGESYTPEEGMVVYYPLKGEGLENNTDYIGQTKTFYIVPEGSYADGAFRRVKGYVEIEITNTDSSIPVATDEHNGLMSAGDKIKLNTLYNWAVQHGMPAVN